MLTKINAIATTLSLHSSQLGTYWDRLANQTTTPPSPTHTHVAYIEEFGVTVLFESTIVLFTLEIGGIKWAGHFVTT